MENLQASVTPQNADRVCELCGAEGHSQESCQYLPDEYRQVGSSSSSSARGNQSRPAQSRQLRRVNTAGASVPGSQETQQESQDDDLARRASGLHIASQPRSASQGPQPHDVLFCPVSGCAGSASGRHHGFSSQDSLRVHLDGHILGTIPGVPDQDWLAERRLRPCTWCRKLLIRGVCNNTMHRRCFAERALQSSRRASVAASSGDVLEADTSNLPSLMDICSAQVATKEYVEPALLALLEPELLKCISKVIECNQAEAWSVDSGEQDRAEWRRCRSAWQELYMICKTCIPQLPGGQKKTRRNINILISRLERWRAGERRTLWEELQV